MTPKAVAEEAAPTFGQKEFQKAVKDLNHTLELEPKLNPITKLDKLEAMIVDTISPLVDADDPKVHTLQPSTLQVYNFLCAKIAAASAAGESAPPAPEPEVEASAAGDAKVEKPKGAKKAKAATEPTCEEFKKSPAVDDPECKKCTWLAPCLEGAGMDAKGKKIKGAKAASKTKAAAKEEYSRTHSICDVLKQHKGKAIKKDALIAAANKVYAAHGGKDNVKEAAGSSFRVLWIALPTLGYATVDGDSITYVG